MTKILPALGCDGQPTLGQRRAGDGAGELPAHQAHQAERGTEEPDGGESQSRLGNRKTPVNGRHTISYVVRNISMNDDWIARVVGRVVFAVRQLSRHDASAHRVEILLGGGDINRVVFESAAPIRVGITVVKREPEEPLPGWPEATFTVQIEPA